MNKKIICLIAVALAIIIGICIGVINNSDKIEKGKSTESLAKMNVVENNIISTNKIEEPVNNTVDNENTILVDETNNTSKETNPTNSNEDKINSSKPDTSKDTKETPKENVSTNAPRENTTPSILEETTPDLSGQVSVVPYAMTKDEIKEVDNGNSHTFKGTVTNVNDVAVIIKPDEGYDGVSGNQISLIKSEFGSGLDLNDRVEITFIGEITKTYPGNIHVVALKKF